MQMIEKIPWTSTPHSWLLYALGSFVDHVVVALLGAALVAVIALWFRRNLRTPLQRWLLFNAALFFAGMMVSGFWDVFIYGHLYVTANYFSDFSPFVPVTRSTIDAHLDGYSGHLMGVTMARLQLVWGLFALCAWGLAFLFYGLIRRFSSRTANIQIPHQALERQKP